MPGRAFTRGMYAKLKLTNAKGVALKDHHHIWLTKDFILDCKVWQKFLMEVGKPHLCRAFTEFQPNPNYEDVHLYSDASLNRNLGFGAVYQNNWIVGQWPEGFGQNCSPSIEFLELFALVMALTVWENCSQLTNS